MLLVVVSPLHGDPAWVAQLSSTKPGTHPAIHASKLEFSLSWKGILKAGFLDIEFEPNHKSKKGHLVVKSSAYSQGVAAKLFPYSHSYWSEIQPRTLDSIYFKATEIDSKEKVVTVNRYHPKKVDVLETTTDFETYKVSSLKKTFNHPKVRDLFSAILFIRSQKLDIGDEHQLLIHPLQSPYLLKVHVEAKEQHHSQDAIRISFSMQKVDPKSHELIPYKKLKKPVTLWLSDNVDRIPLELRASVYIGDVRAVLTKHTKRP